MTNIPTDTNGNPLVEIGVSAEEKINLELINPKLAYSNTVIGTWATTYTEDTSEAREEARKQLTAEIGEYMEAERNQLVEDLKDA